MSTFGGIATNEAIRACLAYTVYNTIILEGKIVFFFCFKTPLLLFHFFVLPLFNITIFVLNCVCFTIMRRNSTSYIISRERQHTINRENNGDPRCPGYFLPLHLDPAVPPKKLGCE